VILDFDDACWSIEDDDWNRSLIEILTLLTHREQHAILAESNLMLQWVKKRLELYDEYFKGRLSGAQPRSKALNLTISPDGMSEVIADPPWRLTAKAAYTIVEAPLRLILENDRSDHAFANATIPGFHNWCSKQHLSVEMGGGGAMGTKIKDAADDHVKRWRTFFMFDSDRLHPSEFAQGWKPPRGDGCQGHVFENVCANLPRDRWHGLQRRSIENYLPPPLLQNLNAKATKALQDPKTGEMAKYYNLKGGLQADGIWPVNPTKAIRASRSQGFWTALPPDFINDLQQGFGAQISEEFNRIPNNYSWSADVIAEADMLSAALQDAM